MAYDSTPLITPRRQGSWQARALIATRGNQSRLGCILIAVLGRTALNPPRIRGSAVITEDGYVLADMQLRGQEPFWFATNLGHIHEIRDNFRGLADHLKLSDTDRESMFDELRKWISKDFRAISNLGEF